MRKQVMKKYVLAALAVMSAGYATANPTDPFAHPQDTENPSTIVSINGNAIGDSSVAVGQDTWTTSSSGSSLGHGAITTGEGMTRVAFDERMAAQQQTIASIKSLDAEMLELNQQRLFKQEELAKLYDQQSRLQALIDSANHKKTWQTTWDEYKAIEQDAKVKKEEIEANYSKHKTLWYERYGSDYYGNQYSVTQLNKFLDELPWGQWSTAEESLPAFAQALKEKLSEVAPDAVAKHDDQSFKNLINSYMTTKITLSAQIEKKAEDIFAKYGAGDRYLVEGALKAKINGRLHTDADSLDAIIINRNWMKDVLLKNHSGEVEHNVYHGGVIPTIKNKQGEEFLALVFYEDRPLWKHEADGDYTDFSIGEEKQKRDRISQIINELDWDDPKLIINKDYKQVLEEEYNRLTYIIDTQAIKEQAKEKVHQGAPQEEIDALSAQVMEREAKIGNGSYLQEIGYTNKSTSTRDYIRMDRLKEIFMDDTYKSIVSEFDNADHLYPFQENNPIAVDVKKSLDDSYNAYKEALSSNDNRVNQAFYVLWSNHVTSRPELTAEEEVAHERTANIIEKIKEVEAVLAQNQLDVEQKNIKIQELRELLKTTDLANKGLRNLASGHMAFSSGDDSVALGSSSSAIGRESVAIGKDSTVSGEQSIALGSGNTVTGDSSIAIGVGHHVSGDRSTTIGDPNVITGNDVFVAGNNNTVASNKVLVLGNNVNVAEGFDGAVVLGDSSAPAKATPVANMVIKNKEYAVAGTTPTATVSVGAKGTERQITNVAAGEVSETSTDAVNGSQLHAVIQSINTMEATSNNMGEITQRIDAKAEQLMQHIGKVEDTLEAAIAGNNAAIALPQVTKPGDVMVSVATGGYAGKGAVAVGVSASSADGKTTFKSQINANSENKFGYGLGLGFVW